MDQSTLLNAALSLGGALIGVFATMIVSWYFFREGEKTDFGHLKDELGKLGNRIENLRSQLPELLRSGWSAVPRQSVEENRPPELRVGLAGKIMTYFEGLVASAREGLLSEEKRADIYNFKKGWGILLDDLFGDDEHETRILRDFAISNHGEISFGGYDFPGYVDILKAHLDKARDTRFIHLRVLILCNSSQESVSCNIAVEKHLEAFLNLKFPHLEKKSSASKLGEWKRAWDNKNAEAGIEIRLIGKSSAENARRRKGLPETPFNVYGKKAVSRSIVKPIRGHPEPHLEILLNKRAVVDCTEAFDELWDAAEDFQEGIFAELGEQDMEKLGKGDLIRDWSSLE